MAEKAARAARMPVWRNDPVVRCLGGDPVYRIAQLAGSALPSQSGSATPCHVWPDRATRWTRPNAACRSTRPDGNAYFIATGTFSGDNPPPCTLKPYRVEAIGNNTYLVSN